MLEVLIAVTFLCTVMVGIGSVLGTQVLSVTSSTTWKVATGLLNQAMEEVRALPDQTLASGLTDLTACDSTVPGGTNADSNISKSGTTWTFALNSEPIPHGDLSCSTTEPPLIPHQTTTTLNHLPFTVAVYPTVPSGMPSGIVRVTAVVSWKRVGLAGISKVTAQTLVYPNTCIAQGNNAYAGPCQPLISAGAGADTGGSIRVSGTVAGLTFDQLYEVLPQASSSMQIQQITTVSGCAITSGGQSFVSGAGQTPVGQTQACSSADNDPGSSTSTWQTSPNPSSSQGALSQTLTGSLLDTLGLNLAAGDTPSSTSTVAATDSPPSGTTTCTDLAGAVQKTSQPCGDSTVANSGAATLSAALVSTLLGSLGSAPLVSLGASTAPASSFVGRYTSTGSSSSYCASPSKTTLDGCVHAGATRSFGLLQLGGLPSGLLGGLLGGGLGLAPTGWGTGSANCPAGNYLVSLVNYSDTVSAESGVDAAAPATSTSGTPYLCYWNGSGYTSTVASLGSTAPSLPINNGSYSFTNLAGTVSVAITSSLAMGTAITSSSPSPWTANTASGCWQSACTARATVTSPVSGSYEIKVSAVNALGGALVTIADLTEQINLGELTASTSYQAAPPQP